MANARTLQQIYKPHFELLENPVLKLHKAQHRNQHYGIERLRDLHMHHWKPTTLHILDWKINEPQNIFIFEFSYFLYAENLNQNARKLYG